VQTPRALAYHLRSSRSPMRQRRSGGRSAQRRNASMATGGIRDARVWVWFKNVG
jgi:hypothetical protein